MTTVQEMPGLRSPVSKQLSQVKLHKTNEAYIKLLERIEQSALKDFGGIKVHLFDYIDRYSTQELIQRLQTGGFEVVETEDAGYYLIIWDNGHSVEPSTVEFGHF